MKLRSHISLLRIACITAGCAIPTIALAQGTFVPLADISQSPRLSGLYDSGNLADFVQKLFTFALIVGAIGGVLRLAYAGYLYMGQSDMWSHKGEAKQIIGDVTLGLILLLAIYLILRQINPDILSLRALDAIKNNPAPAQEPGRLQQSQTPRADNAFTPDVFDPYINGCGVNGCDTFNPEPISP
ncbi:MAG: hypothetical protein RLZZ416_335 [Candidatus Parcubacteria bacterium]|jgi:hypothetical protein